MNRYSFRSASSRRNLAAKGPRVWQMRRGLRVEPLEARLVLAGVEFEVELIDDRPAWDVYPADLDGDGDLDVISGVTNEIAWFENTDGAGTFGPQNVIFTAAMFFQPWSVYATDLDDDGDLDVLTGGQGAGNTTGRVAWFENTDGAGNFGPQQVISTQVGFIRSVYAADLDSDADDDVLSAGFAPDIFAWHENGEDGDVTFKSERLSGSGEGSWPRSIHAADLDGDGDLDALSASFNDNKIGWWENNGEGRFRQQKGITASASGANAVYVADVDGDGDLDVLSASVDDSTIAWYENTDGGGTFGAQSVITTDATGAWSVHSEDVDGDDDIDVLSLSKIGVAWHENTDGAGKFGAPQVISTHVTNDGRGTVHAADVDGDGDIDILATHRTDDGFTGRIVWYRNESPPPPPLRQPGDANEDGQFNQLDIIQVLQAGKYQAGEPATFAEGDWDGDGMFNTLDIVLALQTGNWLKDVA